MSTSLAPVDQLVPGANLAAYVQAVGSIPVLSQEREQELAEDLFYNNNLDAARQLVMSHLRFVVHIQGAAQTVFQPARPEKTARLAEQG